MELTREQLIECYDCVFTSVHSEGFKSSEMKDLITNKDYSFLEQPVNGWRESLIRKLNKFEYYDYGK